MGNILNTLAGARRKGLENPSTPLTYCGMRTTEPGNMGQVETDLSELGAHPGAHEY